MERKTTIQGAAHEERPIGTINGFIALFVALILLVAGGLLIENAITFRGLDWTPFVFGIVLIVLGVLAWRRRRVT